MVTNILLHPLETLLNHGLRQSTVATAMAGGLEGRTLGLQVESAPFDLRIGISGGRFRVTARVPEPPDAGISGSLIGLGRLLGEDPQAAIRDGMVRMTGDAEIADAFRQLLHHAQPDLERELARLVGASMARDAGDAARAFSAWGGRAARGFARDVGEYLTGRARMVVSRAEFEAFSREVDELVNDVARAEARLEQAGPTGGRG